MAGVRDRKRCWQIWWLVPESGKNIRKWARLSKIKFSNKRIALREAHRREIEGELYSTGILSFEKYAKDFIEGKHIADSTKVRCDFTALSFNNFLSRCHPGIAFKDITELVIQGYLNERKLRYSPAGINIDLRFLRELFGNAVERGIFRESPMRFIKYFREEKKVTELPTKQEIERILRWFKKECPVFFPWIYFEATRGWRRDELRLMRINSVDLDGETLYIRNTKTKEQRIVPLSKEDCFLLNEHFIWLKNNGLYHPTGHLFPSKKGNAMGRNKILEKLKRACEDLGITKNITNHTFRHNVVTSILDRTANIEVVKAITGHKDTRTILEHYAHPRTEMVEKALEITKVDTSLL